MTDMEVLLALRREYRPLATWKMAVLVLTQVVCIVINCAVGIPWVALLNLLVAVFLVYVWDHSRQVAADRVWSAWQTHVAVKETQFRIEQMGRDGKW